MNLFTVVLLLPDFLQDGGNHNYVAFVTAKNGRQTGLTVGVPKINPTHWQFVSGSGRGLIAWIAVYCGRAIGRCRTPAILRRSKISIRRRRRLSFHNFDGEG